MANKLPEGYIAPNIHSTTYAVDSKTLAKNGEVHLLGYGSNLHDNLRDRLGWIKGSPALDSFIEFSLKDDARLEDLRPRARAIGKKYGDKNSPDFIADAMGREHAIAVELVEWIYEKYGSYSHETLKNHGNSAEKKPKGVFIPVR